MSINLRTNLNQGRASQFPPHANEARTSAPEFDAAVKHLVRRLFGEAALLYAIFFFSAHVALLRTRGGQIFDLSPKGIGLVIDLLVLVVVMTLFHLLYILPALMVRKWLAMTLRALMYSIFVIFLCWLHWEKVVAVQFLGDRVLAIRHWPRQPTPVNDMPAEFSDTGAAMSLAFMDGTPEGIATLPVYHWDNRTANQLRQLASKVHARNRSQR